MQEHPVKGTMTWCWSQPRRRDRQQFEFHLCLSIKDSIKNLFYVLFLSVNE